MNHLAGGSKARIAGVVVALLASCAVSAQPTSKPAVPVPPPVTPLAGLSSAASRVIPKSPPLPLPSQDFSVKLKWNDATGQLSIPFMNTSDKPLRIDAVQTSGNLFLVNYPKTVPPKVSVNIDVIFEAKVGTSSESDIVRLKTDHGEKLIRVLHEREQVAKLDTTRLSWNEGEAATGKSAILQITSGTTKPVKVRALLGNTALLTDLGGGKYKITVTPKSTVRSNTFPIFIDLEPALSGVTLVITGTVQPKS